VRSVLRSWANSTE